MIFINHRINRLDQLDLVPEGNGIEIDVRYHRNTLILHHEPFGHHEAQSISLTELMQGFPGVGPIILNIKSEGIEEKCVKVMEKFEKDWFFLDLSMPKLMQYAFVLNKSASKISPHNLAVRFSEFEPLEISLALSSRVSWVWVDCFNQFPLDKISYHQLKSHNFKICLVSPELQGHPLKTIEEYQQKLEGLAIDAVCTKRPDLWGQRLDTEMKNRLMEAYPGK